MVLSPQIKESIVNLRRTGHSIPEISRLAKMPRSTVYRLVRIVPVLPQHQARLQARQNTSTIASQKQWIEAKNFAHQHTKTIGVPELMLLGTALYWAEGTKKDLSFMNSDAEMIKLFLVFLRKCFGISNEQLIISLRTYPGLDLDASARFWSKITGKKLNLNEVSVEHSCGSKIAKLPYGMCRVRVRKGGIILKKIIALKNLYTSMPS